MAATTASSNVSESFGPSSLRFCCREPRRIWPSTRPETVGNSCGDGGLWPSDPDEVCPNRDSFCTPSTVLSAGNNPPAPTSLGPDNRGRLSPHDSCAPDSWLSSHGSCSVEA